jgi:hypothetical protein
MADLPEVISVEEETDPWPRPHLSRKVVFVVGTVVAVVVVLVASILRVTPASSARLEVLSRHPLSTPAAERALEERFLAVPDDDEADVSCSGRQARPAHSVRRCHVVYPGGTERLVVLITNARGAEVISER